jgi:hypothetical protein
MLRRLEELDRVDAALGLGAMPYGVPAGSRRPPPRRRWVTVLMGSTVLVLLMGVVVALAPQAAPLRDLLGIQRYGERPTYVAGEGTYAFLATQPGSDQPVGYDPCDTVEVLVNPDGAPRDHRELVDTAFAHVGAATGLDLRVVGETDDRDTDRLDDAGLPEPVLVLWADEDEQPDLGGDVAGYAGSVALGGARLSYVTGVVVLDVEAFAQMAAEPGGAAYRQAVVDHEVGHLVGLDHVDDPGELMYPETGAMTEFGPGDLEGLGRLGAVPCG